MKVIVAGIPRCGTTYMWRSLSGHDGVDIVRTYQGDVIKTHSYAPWHFVGYRAIFMFGDILNSVISTQLHAVTTPHFINCGNFNPLTSVYERDCLHYEKMFDSWNRYNGYPVLMLRYETCYKYEKLISDFLGQSVKLLPFKPRSTHPSIVQGDIVHEIKNTYAFLIDKVNSMPEYKLIYRLRDDPWAHIHNAIKKYEICEG